MKTTINPRLRRLLMACFTSLILATASSLHAEEKDRLHNEEIHIVASDDTYTNLYEATKYYGGAIHNGAEFPASTGIPEHDRGSMTIKAGAKFTGNAAEFGGAIYNNADLTIENGTETQYTSFNNNDASIIENGGAIYQSTVGSLYIGDYTRFENNASKNAGSAIHARGGFSAGNNIVINGNAAGWGAAVYIGLTITDSMQAPVENHVVTFGSNASFTNNTGGAIYNVVGTLEIGTGATFSGNSADAWWQAGAITNVDKTTITNATFTGNSATTSAGAIGNGGELIYNVTENITNTGNTATGAGFLMAGAGSTTTFDIAENATLTIGTGTDTNDSIVSEDATATIIKSGAGTMDVKSSMEGYTGSLDVQAGTMTIEGALNASSITVAAGASLSSANYTITSDTQGIITEKEGMDCAITGEMIKNMSFSNTAVTFDSLHLDNSDIASSSVTATDILVTGESSLTTSELQLSATGVQITLNDNANLTLCAQTAAQLASGSIDAAGDASSTKVTLTATTWTVSGGVATQQMTREGDTLTTYAYSSENTSLTGLTTNADMELLLDDQLTIELTSPAGLQPREEFLFTLELIGIDGLAAGADLSNIKVSMGIYSGTITGTTTSAGGNLVLQGKIIPEPSTATLSLLALAGLLARRRRQNV